MDDNTRGHKEDAPPTVSADEIPIGDGTVDLRGDDAKTREIPVSVKIRTSDIRIDPLRPVMELGGRLERQRIPFADGGTSAVFRADDTNLLRTVAVKALLPELESTETLRARIVEEAQITAQLEHPNIVPVYELGIDEDGREFFTMKLVEGRTLAAVLDEPRKTEMDDAERLHPARLFRLLQIYLKILDAVAFAHSHGIIHRDIKPLNVMVGDHGEVYLMDFGLARMGRGVRPSRRDREMPGAAKRKKYPEPDEEGRVYGTPHYMAPEQARGDPDAMDERTDIYGLGGILYEMLTGEPPHPHPDLNSMVDEKRGSIPPPDLTVSPADLSPQLVRIVMKALQWRPERRFQSVEDLKTDVEEFMWSSWRYNRKDFKEDDLIVKEGDLGDEAYVITAGRCEAFTVVGGREKVYRVMERGDVFGEISVFTGETRTASVRALEPGSAMVLTRKDFEDDLGMTGWLNLFVRTLADRFVEKDKRVIELEAEVERLKHGKG